MISAMGAIEMLASRSVTERLSAARYFQKHGTRADLDRLNRAIKIERVYWIRAALQASISRLQTPSTIISPIPQVDENQDELARDAHSKAIEEVAGILLHELRSVVGAVRIHSSREIPDFQASKTNEAIERLRALLDAIRRLKKAASLPEVVEFDLHSLVASLVRDEESASSHEIKLAGPRPFAVRADPDALYMAIANGLRNAIEAATAQDATRPPEVSVTWGKAGGECFLAILDSGPGLPDNSSLIAQIGTTNKLGHFGFGLATAQQVMDSLDGSMLLSDREGGGALFELRWRHHEDSSD